MKVFSIVGISGSGKTTTLECIIQELRRRGRTVGTVKSIACSSGCENTNCKHQGCRGFTMDRKGTNTYRHRAAGSQLVTARSKDETAVMFQRELAIDELLSLYDFDYVILEGDYKSDVPRLIAAYETSEVDERMTDKTFVISGRLSAQQSSYAGLPVINATTDSKALVDLIEEKVYDRLPNIDKDRCNLCGADCSTLGTRILQGQATRDDCKVNPQPIRLEVDGESIPLNPLVEKLLRDALLDAVGYKSGASITVHMGSKNEG